jgi:hypothetical protein
MKSAASSAVFPVGAMPLQIWGVSLSEILKLVMEKALELGREYRQEIEQAAKSAVDALVAFDLPGIPAGIEKVIDEATRTLGYQAIEKVLDALLAEQVIG